MSAFRASITAVVVGAAASVAAMVLFVWASPRPEGESAGTGAVVRHVSVHPDAAAPRWLESSLVGVRGAGR
jgi:hypothetical protein